MQRISARGGSADTARPRCIGASSGACCARQAVNLEAAQGRTCTAQERIRSPKRSGGLPSRQRRFHKAIEHSRTVFQWRWRRQMCQIGRCKGCRSGSLRWQTSQPYVRRIGPLHSPHRAVFPDADEGEIALDVHTVWPTSGLYLQCLLEEDPARHDVMEKALGPQRLAIARTTEEHHARPIQHTLARSNVKTSPRCCCRHIFVDYIMRSRPMEFPSGPAADYLKIPFDSGPKQEMLGIPFLSATVT